MPQVEDSKRTRIFQLSPEASIAYLAWMKKHQREVSKCRREVLKATGHEAALFDHGQYIYMAGISINPPNWWETETARKKAEAEAKGEEYRHWGFGHKDAPIPPGWRKRVKDDFLCPPLKGGGPEADAARALLAKWRRVESPRGYMQRVHGIKAQFFAGLSFITIGIDVLDEKTDHPTVYAISAGAEQKVEDLVDAVEIKHSAYLVAKGE